MNTMKKLLTVLLALAMVFSFAGCTKKEDIHKKSEGVMTYEEYNKAKKDDKVVIETFVQNKQSWWKDTATLYTQDKDGGYFIYSASCSEADYAKLTEGTKIRVTGYKGEFAGEWEVVDGTIEILEGNWVSTARDMTKDYATANLEDFQNIKFSLKGLKIVDYDGTGAGFAYKGGNQGDDIYFKGEIGGKTFNFTIESYLTDSSTDTYKAAESLKVGDTINIEAFLYWYNGAEPHVTSIKK